jgi:hypothetical protein
VTLHQCYVPADPASDPDARLCQKLTVDPRNVNWRGKDGYTQ